MKKIGVFLITTLIIFIGCYIFVNLSKKESDLEYKIDSSAEKLYISKSIKESFKKAAKTYVGMNLEPIALLGIKKENGNNYAFLVKSKTKSEKEEISWKIITINEKKNEEPMITKINDININDYDTTYLQEFSEDNTWKIYDKSGEQVLNDEIGNYFETLQFENIEYKPIALLGTKEEKGIDYAILCLGRTTNKTNTLDVVIMNVDNNKARIKTINKFKIQEVN